MVMQNVRLVYVDFYHCVNLCSNYVRNKKTKKKKQKNNNNKKAKGKQNKKK